VPIAPSTAAELIGGRARRSDDHTVPLLRFVEQLTPAEVRRLRAALEPSLPLRIRLCQGDAARTEARNMNETLALLAYALGAGPVARPYCGVPRAPPSTAARCCRVANLSASVLLAYAGGLTVTVPAGLSAPHRRPAALVRDGVTRGNTPPRWCAVARLGATVTLALATRTAYMLFTGLRGGAQRPSEHLKPFAPGRTVATQVSTHWW